MWTKTFRSDSGDTYVDHKRGLWLISLLIPMMTLLGPFGYLMSGNEWVLAIPIVVFYGLIPLLDKIIGEDTSNPPESIVPQLEADPFYRLITFLLVPMLVAGFAFTAWFAVNQPLSTWGWIAVVVNNGFLCGYAINLGHEMGHKTSLYERWAAKVSLSLAAYGHFNVEHNLGHHATVATPEDSASSKLGESIYGFFWREYPGAFVRAWRLEAKRLSRRKQSTWNWNNEVLQSVIVALVIYGTIVLWLGIEVLPFLLATALWGGFQLTSANYIEHYGLQRKRMDNGRFELCKPCHSWNSNYLLSNWSLFHLQRHSDHHAYPMRRYQSLRHFDESPQLPAGYYTMFLLAYCPPLWFKIMDPLVLKHAQQDLERVNVLPQKKQLYEAMIQRA
ncbi:alkane 1-monooxygenase [Pleionea litopenaei]|uniref:Alkane 1-monooxygenase n=1 Tax=Pleionea litopenaei TaxID=3070815 RepID=A0AA51RR99_9GAMM|nr:alkane 1-monooxygenase [Pleionea sp. HL-JVS1]WMS86090.1 alkane 1-monooxygenase [Pleionea sp. HL-JVS1]